jgi:hypothetical protein
MTQNTVTIASFKRTQHELRFSFAWCEQQFPMRYCYDTSIDFFQLEKRYGVETMHNIYFHIIAFEVNKFASIKPNVIDFGEFSRFQTKAFENLWRTIIVNAWAQWRYENNIIQYVGPEFSVPSAAASTTKPIRLQDSETEILLFTSSGKDSLACLSLLTDAGVVFDTLTYACNVYGDMDQQHRSGEAIAVNANVGQQRKQWIEDSFLNSNILDHPNVETCTLIAAETPSSIFASLPYVLMHDYHYIALGHERSANSGQLRWDKTGEEINHQWGKSFAAETLLNDYIRTHLISNFSVFSLLQPIHDVLIFTLMNNNLAVIEHSNSCNIDIQGCGSCPKCIYVDLGFKAYLPKDAPFREFKTDPFDIEQNQFLYRQLLGLEQHLPFECIGQQDETNLAFALCVAKGYQGKALKQYQAAHLAPPDIEQLQNRYLNVHTEHNIPQFVAENVIPLMMIAAEQAKQEISLQLGWTLT